MKAELQPFGPYHLCRWFHVGLFFAMAVGGGLLAGPELEDPKDVKVFVTALAAGVICLFMETCYLGLNRWRMSLAYLLHVTTYLALSGEAAITAFNLSPGGL